MLLERRIDVVTFTSASAVRGFVKAVGAEPAADLLGATVVAAIGPVTAEAAAQCNIHSTIMPFAVTRSRRWSMRSSTHFAVRASPSPGLNARTSSEDTTRIPLKISTRRLPRRLRLSR